MEGKIIGISGSVVMVADLEDPKMNNIVFIGEKNLVGEIVKIEKDSAIVQVYEDTSGLRVGEAAVDSREPLSVELGPGLIGSIFDGIQRPLDKILDKEGTFISSGVKVDSLDREKKWHFKPKMEVGQEVSSGEEIGEIKETSLIKHRVMIPVNMHGVIKKIVEEGDYTVEETIAVLENENRKEEIKLMTKWSVRTPRPVKEKLAPNIPLLTGQRVIDAMFPIAMGGTAAVPGPFGSGKCVAGDTPILLADGGVEDIEKLYEKSLSKGKIEYQDENETLIKLDSPIKAYSFYNGEVSESQSDFIYKGKSDSLLKIKTATGKEVKITPTHKLFKLDGESGIVETPAKLLNEGDYIVSVRKFKNENDNQKVHIESVFRDSQDIRRLQGRNSIKIPEYTSEHLSELLGLYAAGGHIRGRNTFVFANNDEKILSRVGYLIKELFNLNGKLERQSTKTSSLIVKNTYLAKFIIALTRGKSSNEIFVPEVIMKSNYKVISAFLKGYYLVNGNYYGEELEIITNNKRLQTGMSYLLTRLGILHSLHPNENKIFINELHDFEKFYSNIKTESENYAKIDKIKMYKSSKQNACFATNLSTIQNKSTAMVNLQSMNVNNSNSMQLQYLSGLTEALNFIYFDRIEKINEIQGPFDVYDITTPEFGSNFVGGNGAILLHNTVIQHQLAKWSDADVIVYVGCGERGNEMTEILTTFPELKDPKSGKPLMDRTILIANTSNMPVAAREASIYTGITLAEYYRDMGYSVAVMADSTSRWAEALRELSGRLEEMPGEEGYPAYLGRRVGEFYERAGRARLLNGKIGATTLVGAVSPPGGDISEPVSQNTLRVTRVFWALDASLANARHFPSINWLNSYSLYKDELDNWYKKNVAEDWPRLRDRALATLQKEAEINEIVQLVGYDALPEADKLILDIARILREDFLQQNAFDDIDTYASMSKQYKMLKLINQVFDCEKDALVRSVPMQKIQEIPIKQKISRLRYTNENELDGKIKEIELEIEKIKGLNGEK